MLLGARSLWRLAVLPAVSSVLSRSPSLVDEVRGKAMVYQDYVVCRVHAIRDRKFLSWVGGGVFGYVE